MNTPLQECNPLSLGVNLDPQLIQINILQRGLFYLELIQLS